MTLVEYSDTIKKSLEEFSKQDKKVVTPELNNIIENISKTGVTCYPWDLLKELFYFKLTEILDIFEKESTLSNSTTNTATTTSSSSSSSSTNSPQSPQSPSTPNTNIVNNTSIKDEEMAKIKNQVNLSGLVKMKKEFLDSFKESKLSPFTIQRLCELIINYKMYTSFSKYLCAVEKMLNVSSLPHLTPEEVIEYNKNQNLSTSRLTTTNSNENQQNSFIPSLEGYAFSSSFTSSFPATTTSSSSLSTDQEMKDVEQKDEDDENEEDEKEKKEDKDKTTNNNSNKESGSN